MKKQLLLLIIACTICISLKSQITYTLITTPPTCPTCCDGIVELNNVTGGCAPYQYVWENATTTPIINGICYGDSLSFIISDMCGGVASGVARMGVATGINTNESLSNVLSLFPNPTKDLVSIVSNKEIIEVQIIDITGRIVENIAAIHSKNYVWHRTGILSGIYLIQIKTKQQTKNYKLILEE